MRATQRNRNTPELFEERERVRGKVTWNVNVTLIENSVCSIESYSSTKCNDSLTAYIYAARYDVPQLFWSSQDAPWHGVWDAHSTPTKAAAVVMAKNATHRILGWLQRRLERLRAKPTNCANREDDNVITYKDNHVSVCSLVNFSSRNAIAPIASMHFIHFCPHTTSVASLNGCRTPHSQNCCLQYLKKFYFSFELQAL